MRILFLSSWFPSPPLNGAKIRINNLLGYLCERHTVTLFALNNTLSAELVAQELPRWQALCETAQVLPLPTERANIGRLGLFSRYPRALLARESAEVWAALRALYAAASYDWVVVSEVGPAAGLSFYAGQLASLYPFRHVLDCLEVAYYHDAMAAGQPLPRRFARWFTWFKTSHYLKGLLRQFALCTVPSAQEQAYIQPLCSPKTRLAIVPHSLDLTQLQLSAEPPQPDTLVYVGSLTYAPNADAVLYFLQEIFPLVLAQVPQARLQVLGAVGDFAVVDWQSRLPVQFLGLHTDVRPLIQRSQVNIVPLRQGSGTRLKIVESLALGTPVVATSKGAEGLAVQANRDMLLADTPADFAQAVVRLLREPALRASLREAGRQLVEQTYARPLVGRLFEQLLETTV